MKRILMVDDDPLIVKVYQDLLQEVGFQVDVAWDGEGAIRAIDTNPPDLVLLDLMLPKVNGLEVLKHIRLQPATREVPVIVFSNSFLTTMVQAAKKAGADACLTKADISPEQLVETVRSYLGVTDLSQTTDTRDSKKESGIPIDYSTPESDLAAALPTEGPGSFAPSEPANSFSPTPSEPIPPSIKVGKTRSFINLFDPDSDAYSEDETIAYAELSQNFIRGMPKILNLLRTRLHMWAHSDSDRIMQMRQVQELYDSVRTLTGKAGILGYSRIAHLCNALEALLKELVDEPEYINKSSLRTVGHAVDFLAELCKFSRKARSPASTPALILVVDDEVISRQTLCAALELANLKSLGVDDPNIALKLLEENRFDLVFLDVNMPGMNGFELCTKLRAMPSNRTTPVVFVTSLSDLESRARSTLSGGNDFIAKPFLMTELSAKALTFVLKQHVESKG